MKGRSRRLRDEIRQYRPDDPAEILNRERFLSLLETAPDSFRRDHFDPGHLTASGFVIEPSGRLLLHHHRRLGRWLQLGGHLDEGEDPREAALRESQEESGLRDLRFALPGILDLDIHSIPAGRGEPPHLHFDVRFLLATDDPSSAVHDESESIELGWFTLPRADELMSAQESTRVLRKIARILA